MQQGITESISQMITIGTYIFGLKPLGNSCHLFVLIWLIKWGSIQRLWNWKHTIDLMTANITGYMYAIGHNKRWTSLQENYARIPWDVYKNYSPIADTAVGALSLLVSGKSLCLMDSSWIQLLSNVFSDLLYLDSTLEKSGFPAGNNTVCLL